jgi:hypothetical protein
MNFRLLQSWLHTTHLLSLDVVLGATCWAIVVWKLPHGHAEVNSLAVITLALSIFLTYTLDRLFDIKKRPTINTLRHLFHAQHSDMLQKICYVCGTILMVVALFLPLSLIIFGISVAIFTTLYLFLVNRLASEHLFHAFKEPLVALVYALGIWGGVMVVRIFGLVAFQNLLLFSWMEAFETAEDQSLAIVWGEELSQKVIIAISLIVFVTNFSLLFLCETNFQRRICCILILMAFFQTVFTLKPSIFLKNERYRWLGEGIFWLMGLVLI